LMTGPIYRYADVFFISIMHCKEQSGDDTSLI
jgi:hypothetical protein